jgi:hypothetical protein
MHSRAACSLLALLIVGCGPSHDRPASSTADGAEHVEQRTIVEKTPTGTRTTIITTTSRMVEAPPPPVRPADPFPGDPLVKFNVDLLNSYRDKAGLPALSYDAKISAFALDGSKQLSRDHSPHAYFAANVSGAPGFGSRSAENQGDPSGVPAMDPDPVASGKKQIQTLLKIMMDEGPGGGHHDNVLNPKYRRVGVGLFYAGGRLYLTNDFSD